MPKRPRSHELETESQRAFEQALHKSMVARPVIDDYGIDREVEVFEDGEATGLTFKVQLKGTGKSGKSVRIKREHLAYWTNLDVPVLLVTYESSTRILRTRWAHAVGSDAPDNGSKSVTVRMDHSGVDILSNPARMINELLTLRSLRRGEFPNPVPIAMVLEDGLPWQPGELEAALLVRSRESRHPMIVASSPHDPAVRISLNMKEFKVALPLSYASCTLHISKVGVPAAEIREIAELVIMLCTVVASRVNEQTALDWLETVRPMSPWWEVDAITELMWPLLLGDRMGPLALAMYNSRSAAGLQIPWWLEFSLHGAWGSLPDEEFREVAVTIERSLPDDAEGGRLAFNLGTAFQSRSEYAYAKRLFDLAVDRNPSYAQDYLFLRNMAGCLWQLGQYSAAADSYRRAIDVGGDAYELLPLAADCLLHSGEYAEALELLQSWEPRGQQLDRVGVLRIAVLRHLCHVVGVHHQDRGTADGTRGRATRPKIARESSRQDLLSDLKSRDALSIESWLALADCSPDEHGLKGLLTAALIAHDDPDLWMLALVASIEYEDGASLAPHIVDQARFACGEVFYDFAMDFPKDLSPQRDALVELVEQRFRKEPESTASTFRLVDPHGEVWVTESIEVHYER